MRNISFSLTTPQFLDGSKTVTRRLRWRKLKAGDRLMAVKKGMGLKKGEKVERLGEIEVLSVRRERLDAMTTEDCAREGFPEMLAWQFVMFFCEHNGCEGQSRATSRASSSAAYDPADLAPLRGGRTRALPLRAPRERALGDGRARASGRRRFSDEGRALRVPVSPRRPSAHAGRFAMRTLGPLPRDPGACCLEPAPRSWQAVTENPGRGARTRVTFATCARCDLSWILKKERLP